MLFRHFGSHSRNERRKFRWWNRSEDVQYIVFFKVLVACSFRVTRVITRRKSFEFNWPEVRLKEKYTAWAKCHIINYLLSRTGEYWPSVVFSRTSRCSVRTVKTSFQYSPVRPSRSVSKRFQYCRPCKGDFVLFYTSIKQPGRFEVATLKEWQHGNVTSKQFIHETVCGKLNLLLLPHYSADNLSL